MDVYEVFYKNTVAEEVKVKKTEYDYVIVTQLPAFYKINLYNEMSKRLKLFVIFLGTSTVESRSTDFCSIEDACFDFLIVHEGNFQNRNRLLSAYKIFKALNRTNFSILITGGWDLFESWVLAFWYPKNFNSLALESGKESKTKGFKGFIKKVFLSRIKVVFVSGNAQKEVVEKLGFKKNIYTTGGVGIINKIAYNRKSSVYSGKFLYVGRISKEKNLELLISTFKEMPSISLSCIGTGPDLDLLEKIAPQNVNFLGSLKNSILVEYYLNYDYLILPSYSEPWGLVIEEALYYGLPVICSNNCGASELIQPSKNGYIFSLEEKLNLKTLLDSINNQNQYLSFNNKNMNFIDDKDAQQVKVYSDALEVHKKLN